MHWVSKRVVQPTESKMERHLEMSMAPRWTHFLHSLADLKGTTRVESYLQQETNLGHPLVVQKEGKKTLSGAQWDAMWVVHWVGLETH